MTMGAAILCQAACISDIINKTEMCGKSIKYIRSQTFSSVNTETEELKFKSILLLYEYW